MKGNRCIFLLLIILLIGLLPRLGLLGYFWDKAPKIVDATHYQAIAKNIYNHHEFAHTKGRLTSMRPPLYPALLSAIYCLTGGIHLNAVRIVQIILSLGLIFMVYLLGKKIFGQKIGLLAALIFALYPSFLFFTHFLLTEVLFTLLLTLFVWFFLLFMETKRTRDIWWAGLFLGLGALTKSMLYLFIIFALIYLFLGVKEPFWKKIKWMSLFMAGYLVVIGPWAVRNTLLHKSFVLIETAGGINLYTGNYEHTPLNRAWAAIDLKGDKAWYYGHEQMLSGMNEPQKGKWAFNKAKKFILGHKLLTLRRNLIKLANFWGLERVIIAGISFGNYPGLDHKAFFILLTLGIFSVYILVVLSSTFGLISNLKPNRYDLIFILMLICYFTGIYTITVGHSRYHLPLIPFLTIFASWSLLNLKSICGKRKLLRFKGSLLISSIFIFIWIREIAFIDSARYLEYLKNLIF